MRIGLVVAMEKEINPFLKLSNSYSVKEVAGNLVYQFEDYPGLTAVQCNVGNIQAAIGTQLLIREYSVERVINFGYAGYFGNDLTKGSSVNVDTVFHGDMDITIAGRAPGQYDNFSNIGFKIDDLFLNDHFPVHRNLTSSDRFLDNGFEKEQLINRFGRNLSDMEGAGIAVTCAKYKIPCSMIKCISNGINESYQDYYSFSLSGIKECAITVFEALKPYIM